MGASTSVCARRAPSSAEVPPGVIDERRLLVPLHKSPPTTRSSATCGYESAFKIGEGAFSDVRVAYRKDSGEKVCIKEINVSYYAKEFVNECPFEFNILSQLSHPHIVKLIEVFYTKKVYYMVTELLLGGELFDSICEREYYTEGDARRVMQTTTEALVYCHSHNVIHRDIKPENLILQDKSPDSKVKLIDFGFARVLTDKMGNFSDIRGSCMYLSPEMIGGSYGFSTDVWSLGVVFFVLLSGVFPFESPSGDLDETKEIICRGKFTFPAHLWSGVSLQAKDLVSRMLTLDPVERITMAGVLEHPWMCSKQSKEIDISKSIESIRTFQRNKRMKAAAVAVKASMVFKSSAQGGLRLKKKLLDAEKVRTVSRSDSLASTRGKQETKDCEVELGTGDDGLRKDKVYTPQLWSEDDIEDCEPLRQ